jgi:RNA polymerase sigma-70 factor (ECF subfamily)
MSERLNAAFAALRESDREVLRLVAWDGLSRHDAATVLDISAAVFSLRLHRARRRLARALGDGGEQERRPDGSSSVEVIR